VVKISAGLQIARWEALDLDIIPQADGAGVRGLKARDVMKARRAVREQVGVHDLIGLPRV
jgi:hypothetical protein